MKKIEGTDIWWSVLKKTASSLIGAVFGAVLTYFLVWENRDMLVLSFFILIGLGGLLILFTCYIFKKPVDRTISANYSRYFVRDVFKSLFNTLLFAASLFKLALCVYAYKSTDNESFYLALPTAFQNQISVNSPMLDGFLTVLIASAIYMAFNMTINYITADSEKKAKDALEAKKSLANAM
ncbi:MULTISPECIES: hypothetical protein [unclassified Pseudomonas]|uniref:hypothetical protein n=1 Tax=unclassified Pseudomonas TaxID=196821 RepID=UPI00385E2604